MLISRKNWTKKDTKSKSKPLSKERRRRLSLLLIKLGARLSSRHLWLINQSLTHSSYAVETGNHAEDNERLEFLGDAVLGLVVSHHLFKSFPHLYEGDMTRLKSSVVSRRILAKVAKEIQLGDYLLMGKGEEQDGGRQKSSLLSDSLEALLGALFLCLGYEKIKSVVLLLLEKEIRHLLEGGKTEDYKSELQQRFLSLHRILPHYEVVREEGPAHRKRFFVQVKLHGKVVGEGAGNSKKEAEQKAAKEALAVLGSHPSAPRLTLPAEVV